MSKPTLEESLAALRPNAEPSARLTARLARMAASVEPEEVRPESRPSYARLYLALGSAVALLGGFAFVANRLGAPPPKPPPAAPKVTRNAQTTLDEAYRIYREREKQSRYFISSEEIYKRHQKRLRALSGQEAVLALEALRMEQKPTMALIRKGLSEPFVAPRREVYTVNDFSEKNPFQLCYFSLASLLQASSRAKDNAGDISGALADALSAVELGFKVEKGTQLAGWSAAQTAKGIGLEAVARLASKLDAASARSALARLETLDAGRATRAETLEATRWAAYKTFQTKSWDRCMFDFVISYGPRSALALKATPKSWIVAEHLRYLDALKTDENAAPPLDAFNQYMASHWGSAFESGRYTELSLGGTKLTLAIRLWQKERGKALPSLQELVDAGYLKRLPPDPYAPDQPLKLSANGAIYSVGPDGIDDGGIPLRSSIKERGDFYFSVSKDRF